MVKRLEPFCAFSNFGVIISEMIYLFLTPARWPVHKVHARIQVDGRDADLGETELIGAVERPTCTLPEGSATMGTGIPTTFGSSFLSSPLRQAVVASTQIHTRAMRRDGELTATSERGSTT